MICTNRVIVGGLVWKEPIPQPLPPYLDCPGIQLNELAFFGDSLPSVLYCTDSKSGLVFTLYNHHTNGAVSLSLFCRLVPCTQSTSTTNVRRYQATSFVQQSAANFDGDNICLALFSSWVKLFAIILYFRQRRPVLTCFAIKIRLLGFVRINTSGTSQCSYELITVHNKWTTFKLAILVNIENL